MQYGCFLTAISFPQWSVTLWATQHYLCNITLFILLMNLLNWWKILPTVSHCEHRSVFDLIIMHSYHDIVLDDIQYKRPLLLQHAQLTAIHDIVQDDVQYKRPLLLQHAQLTAIIIIIIIIKRGRQCKAEREWYTPYQSEDPSPTIPTYWQKEKKGKNSRRLL